MTEAELKIAFEAFKKAHPGKRCKIILGPLRPVLDHTPIHTVKVWKPGDILKSIDFEVDDG